MEWREKAGQWPKSISRGLGAVVCHLRSAAVSLWVGQKLGAGYVCVDILHAVRKVIQLATVPPAFARCAIHVAHNHPLHRRHSRAGCRHRVLPDGR